MLTSVRDSYARRYAHIGGAHEQMDIRRLAGWYNRGVAGSATEADETTVHIVRLRVIVDRSAGE